MLRYLDGEKETNDPAIVVHRVGNGRVVTFTTTANSDWNTLPLKPCYLELLHEMLAGTIDIGDRWMNVEVGECVQVPSILGVRGEPKLTDSSDKPLAMQTVNTPDGRAVYRSMPILHPGLYKMFYETANGPDVRYIAVNVPADQADISLLPKAAVKKALGDIDLEMLEDATPLAGLARRDGRDLGWFVMVLVLLLAGVESFMAMHFGHYRRKAALAPSAGGVETPQIATNGQQVAAGAANDA